MPINSFLYPAKNVPTVYDVDNSLRFNDGSSDSLTKSFSGSGNRKTWTLSVWFKLGLTPPASRLFSIGNDASNDILSIFFTSGDLRFENTVSGSHTLEFRTDQVFRDPSAWSHLVFAVDTTQSTSSDRVKIYHNGSQITSFSTSNYPSQNSDTLWNHTTGSATIGARAASPSNTYFDGYMAEIVSIDGQALDPTSFGEFDEDSPTIWKPKSVSGLTFGTNGFYLEFKQSGTSQNSSGLGADTSGNDHHFAVNNLTSVDQSLDTCTNNACTFNPLRANNDSGTLRSPSFDNGNLRAIFDDSGYNELAFASIGVDTGKWFCEMKAEDITATGNTRIGVLDMDYTGTGNPADQSSSVSYLADGQKRVGGSNSSYGASYTNGDIIGVALDVTNNTVTFYKNGASQGSISITANTLYTFYCEDYASSGNKEISANFSSPAYSVSSGNSDANGYGNFEYAVPSGYYALNTKNLAEFG